MANKQNINLDELPSVDEIKSIVEKQLPDVYSRRLTLINSENKSFKKSVMINFRTGEVASAKDAFTAKKDKIAASHLLLYPKQTTAQSNTNSQNVYTHIDTFIIQDNLVIARWVLHNPFKQGISLYHGNTHTIDIAELKRYNLIDNSYMGEELMRLKIDKDIFIESMVMVTKEKVTLSWSADISQYGLQNAYGDNIYTRMISLSDMQKIPHYKDTLRKFFKWGFIGSNQYSILTENIDIYKFLRTPDLIRKSGKAQREVDDICAYNLPSHTPSGPIGQSVCFVDRVNDEWAVLRWYLIHSLNESKEVIRLYVNKTEQMICRVNRENDWLRYNGKLVADSFKTDKVILQNENVLDGTKMEYFKSIYQSLSAPGAALYMFSTYPEFEKLYKIGLKSLCNLYLASKKPGKWLEYVEHYLGRVDFSEKNFLNAIGLNSYQVKKVSEFFDKKYDDALNSMSGYVFFSPYSIVSKVKRIYHTDKLNFLDDSTFDCVFELISTYQGDIFGLVEVMDTAISLYSHNGLKYVKNILEIQLTDNRGIAVTTSADGYIRIRKNAFMIFQDILRMIENGHYEARIKPKVNNLEELGALHDLLVDLTNTDAEANQRRINIESAKKFKARIPIWQKWEYDDDDKYVVIAPQYPVDIVFEGVELRHCVGSYVKDVTNGNTNIIFIREKIRPDKPFFTVEIENDGKVRQIHGFANRNVKTEPGLQEFIDKWGKEKKLTGYKSANRVLAAGT